MSTVQCASKGMNLKNMYRLYREERLTAAGLFRSEVVQQLTASGSLRFGGSCVARTGGG